MLTWGPNPSDLDSMVRFFDENGNEVCKLYYSNKNCEDYATLDVDETNVKYFFCTEKFETKYILNECFSFSFSFSGWHQWSRNHLN